MQMGKKQCNGYQQETLDDTCLYVIYGSMDIGVAKTQRAGWSGGDREAIGGISRRCFRKGSDYNLVPADFDHVMSQSAG